MGQLIGFKGLEEQRGNYCELERFRVLGFGVYYETICKMRNPPSIVTQHLIGWHAKRHLLITLKLNGARDMAITQ